jgi:hypothetical protein
MHYDRKLHPCRPVLAITANLQQSLSYGVFAGRRQVGEHAKVPTMKYDYSNYVLL